MPSFKYVVELSEQNKTVLLEIVSKGTSKARKILRANILLASDKQSDKHIVFAVFYLQISCYFFHFDRLFRKSTSATTV